MSKHKSGDYKKAAVEYYLGSDVNQLQVCEIFRCSPRSLIRWTERYLATGEIERHDKPAVAYKVRQHHVDFILEEIKKNRTITLNEIRQKLQEYSPEFTISIAHLHRIIRDNHISLKLRRVRHEPQLRYGKTIDLKKELSIFYGQVSNFDLDDIICLDETNISIFQKRNFCYSPVGRRCVITTRSQEVFKRYTVIFAISTQGVVGWHLYPKGGIDASRLKVFLEQFIMSKYINKLIIMDNASSHRNPTIKKLIKENNHLLYSVPYQHFTNAIENFFSILKSHLKRKECHNLQGLIEQLEETISDIPIEYYKNLFKGVYSRLEKFEKRDSRPKKSKTYLE